jgi:hypothetical protein
MKFKILGCFTLSYFLGPSLRHAEAVMYQAPESMTSIGGGALEAHSTSIAGGASSGAKNLVDFGGSGSFIDWPVDIQDEGNYVVGFQYASSSPRPLQLFVEENVGSYNLKANFAIVPTSTAPDVAWTTYITETKQITLCSTGTKMFHLVSPGKGPNIDYVTVNYVVDSSNSCGGGPTPSDIIDGSECMVPLNERCC